MIRNYVNNATKYLDKLHWLPVRERINYKILMYVFKCLNGMGPEYLGCQFTPYTNARSRLRSSIYTTLLAVPDFLHKKYQSAADKCFFSTAPKLWNALPSSLRSSPTLPVFKKNLKTHLSPM